MTLPRLCFLSYRAIREFAAPVLADYADRARIEVVDGSFDQALAIAHDRVARGTVDAFVSAGANAALLRRHLHAPVATIPLGGFDILQALIRARQHTRRVGIVMYGQIIPELEAVKGLLNIGIEQHAYTTPAEARARIATLQAAGVGVVVGSSLVVEAAAEAGLQGILAYSLASIRQGFDHALELARVARLEAGRYEQLNAVLQHLQDAVLAVDAQGTVTAANPAMQQALGLPATPLPGRRLDELPADLELQPLLLGAAADRGVLRLAGRDWVADRRPIVERGAVAGATLTLYDAGSIHEADSRLRSQQRRRQVSGSRGARWRFEDLLGRDAAFVRTLDTARRYARTELSILIRGDSGTGKELLAQAIHQASARAARPFVAINCAALPEGLLESELFGHEEGAFTGARRGGQRGLFEAAHTGTLFLDEIGDMPLALQTRLLRALQEREVQRLGAAGSIPVDVRVIAATHQPLDDMLRRQRFRADLFHRLDTLRLTLPPLRDRRGDIVLLAQALLADALRRHRSTVPAQTLLAPLLPHLERYSWPGNVRELGNVMERLAVFALQATRVQDLDLADFALECPGLFDGTPLSPATTSAQDRAERARRALAAHGDSATRAAQHLGISRSTLWRWLQQP
jgi:propionate catabolism operon transcriptional regulator